MNNIPIPLSSGNEDLQLEVILTDQIAKIRLYSISRQAVYYGLPCLQGFLHQQDRGGVTPRIVWFDSNHFPLAGVDGWAEALDYDLYDTPIDKVVAEIKRRVDAPEFTQLLKNIPSEEWILED